MTLVVDRKTLALRGLVLKTEDGMQTFTFTRFRANTGLKDSDFNFTFPKGTDIR
jgi:outer membrane lipoprotein-sorting protein